MNAKVVVGSVALVGTALVVGIPTSQKMMQSDTAVMAPSIDAQLPSPIGIPRPRDAGQPQIGHMGTGQLPVDIANAPAASGTSDWPQNEPPVVDLGDLGSGNADPSPPRAMARMSTPRPVVPDSQIIGSTSLKTAPAPMALPMEAPRLQPTIPAEDIGVLPRELAPEAMVEVPEPATSAMQAPSENPAAIRRSGEDFERVQVFYGTDRGTATRRKSASGFTVNQFGLTLTLLVLALVFFAASLLVSYRRLLRAFSVIAAVAALGCGTLAVISTTGSNVIMVGTNYGNDRGTLVMGMCEVSIPSVHKEGEVESPSFLRLEIRQDPLKHVVLQSTEPLPQDEYFAQMKQRVANSPRKDVFVFVHGFNVSFEDAARRTAQIAYDLKFEGAPVFYSWPSQAGLLQYTVDETNVEWTVPHLRQFLLEIAENSGADSVNLVAHSMGNRALTNALKGLSYRLKGERIFSEVVLTAPDIDAEIFKRDIAPQIIKTASRVTLYASSNDEALLLSKKIHGAPRAGDSGSNLMVIPGIETIDVSAVDTSLLGHSYYGSNQTVMSDMGQLLRNSPTDQRRWLGLMSRGGMSYWVFLNQETAGLRSPQPQ